MDETRQSSLTPQSARDTHVSKSVEMLFNKKIGILTYDDELVGFCANDVEQKGLINQKASK